MTVYLSRGLCAAIACVASTQTAFADLSAQDVWTDWKTYLSSAGYTVSGDEQTSGNVLTVSNIAMSMELPEDEGDISIGIGSVNFTENGDGTVSIDMPESIPVNMSVIGENASAVDFVVTYVNKDQVLKASGEANDLLYTYAASSIGFDMTSLTVDGEAIPASMAQGSMSLTKLAGTTRMTVGDTRNYAQEMTAESLNYDLNFKDPESDDNGTIVGAMQGIGITGTGVLPKDMNPNDVVKMLADGFAADGTFTYASGTSSIKGTGDGEPFAFSSASQGGQVGVRLDAGQLAYNVEQKQTALSMQGAELPFPVELNAQVAALDIAFPMMKSDDPQDFSAGLTLSSFTMSDMLWSIFDPAGQLPRDPADLELDLTGKAKVLIDFLDPQSAEQLEQSEDIPMELDSLSINKLLVSLVGASLSGTGAFTFDNTDLQTFEGFPRPAGQLDLQLKGANALLDTLINMGFVGKEEAMGARMMMGMLAVPGDSPDTLNSKIEVTDQGHVLANGQRIR